MLQNMCPNMPGLVVFSVRLPVLLLARYDGRRPAVDDPRGDLSEGYLAVVRPVRHVLRRHHRERLDALVGVVRLYGRLVVLLVVVRSVDEEVSVVFHRGRVRAEVVVEQRIPEELAVFKLGRPGRREIVRCAFERGGHFSVACDNGRAY